MYLPEHRLKKDRFEIIKTKAFNPEKPWHVYKVIAENPGHTRDLQYLCDFKTKAEALIFEKRMIKK